jgi:hypothetical protein
MSLFGKTGFEKKPTSTTNLWLVKAFWYNTVNLCNYLAQKKYNAIIRQRNQVIHADENISDEYIWSILINHLPKLKI